MLGAEKVDIREVFQHIRTGCVQNEDKNKKQDANDDSPAEKREDGPRKKGVVIAIDAENYNNINKQLNE